MTTAAVGDITSIAEARAALETIGAAATTFLDSSDQAKADAARTRGEAVAIRAAAEQMQAGMSAEEVDSQTVAEVGAMLEQASALEAAAQQLEAAAAALGVAADGMGASADTALSGLNARHSGLEEAHNAAPEGGATKRFYTGGR